MTKDEIKNWLRIDEGQLDMEWLTFAAVHQEICENHAAKKLKYESEAAELDYLEARLHVEAQNNPQRFNMKKTTDIARKQMVEIQPEIRKQKERVRLANHELKEWDHMLTCAGAKRKALENLVTLYTMNYFSEPSSRKVAPVMKTVKGSMGERKATVKKIRRRRS